jgi:hypothetical protein
MRSLLGPPQRLAWFGSSTKAVVDGAGVVMAVRGLGSLNR